MEWYMLYTNQRTNLDLSTTMEQWSDFNEKVGDQYEKIKTWRMELATEIVKGKIFVNHSKNWSVVLTLITAQKQFLGKCYFNTIKCLFKGENDTFKCEKDLLRAKRHIF
jgi:hypothetical protein